jgi:TrmH family RNA methyltransferase
MNPPAELITSVRNPLVKRIRALGHRDARQAEGVIVIEGLRAIIEAAQSGVAIETILYAPERLRSALARETIAAAGERGAPLVAATPAVLDALSERDASQGIVAVAARPHAALSAIPATGAPLVLALHEPQDPGNIGTIARTADGAGAVALVIFGARAADPFDPKAIRASMGSLFALPVIEVRGIAEALAGLRGRGLRLVGAAGAGAIDLWDAPLTGPTAILLGNERAGLPAEALAACDAIVRIPMHGHADSLNVAAAAAICAFEAVRQRR